MQADLKLGTEELSVCSDTLPTYYPSQVQDHKWSYKSLKNSLNSNKTQTFKRYALESSLDLAILQSPVHITGMLWRFLLENTLLLPLKKKGPHRNIGYTGWSIELWLWYWWDQNLIYSFAWTFWVAYGLNQCSKENCDFLVSLAVKSATSATFGFCQWVREIKSFFVLKGCLSLWDEMTISWEENTVNKKNLETCLEVLSQT